MGSDLLAISSDRHPMVLFGIPTEFHRKPVELYQVSI